VRTLNTGIAVALLLVTGSGCSSSTDTPEGQPTPATSTAPTPTATQSAAPPDRRDGVHCLAVRARLAQRIASGERRGVDVIAGRAVAVRSPDFDEVYLVAMQFEVAGTSGVELGVWAIGTSVGADARRRIMAVDREAQKYTRWPGAHLSRTDHNVGEVRACQLI
jgi:hypothetical protein